MVTAEYINPLKQFGKVQYDLVIKDGEKEVFRGTREFDENVTDAEMQTYAQAKIDELSVPVTVEVVTEEVVTLKTTTVENPAVIQDATIVEVTIKKPKAVTPAVEEIV